MVNHMQPLGKLKQMFTPRTSLFMLLLISLFYRVYPLFRFQYLFGFDPYVHLSVIREMMHGTLNGIYTLSNAPFGAKITEPMGLYYTPLYLYKIFRIFGVSLYDSFRVTPVIFGILTITLLYITLLHTYGKREALLSTLFLALSWGHIHRSMANYYRGDNYILFLFSFSLFLLSLMLKEEEKTMKYYGYPLGIGVTLGISAFFWWGYPILFVFVLGMAVFWGFAAFLKESKQAPKGLLLLLGATIIGALIAKVVSGEHWSMLYANFPVLFFKYLFLPSLLILLTLLGLSKIKLEIRYKLAILLVLGLIGGTIFLAIFKEQMGQFIEGFGYLSNEGFYTTIMELQRPGISDLWHAFSLSLLASPFYYLILKRRDAFAIISLGWILPSMYLLASAVRFVFLASLAFAFMGGLGLSELVDLIEEHYPQRKIMSSLIVLMIFLSMGALSFNSVRNTKPFMDKNWEGALLYLENSSNKSDVVLTWWDYGGFVQYYAERPTVADSVYGQGNARYVAKYYLRLLPDKEIQKRSVKYVIVNLGLVNKFGTIVETANADKESYFMMLLPLKQGLGTLIFSKGEYTILAKPGTEWEVSVRTPRSIFVPNKVLVEKGSNISAVNLKKSGVTAKVIVYINLNYGYAVLMNENTFNTTLARLMFASNDPLYSDGGIIKIFKIQSGEK